MIGVCVTKRCERGKGERGRKSSSKPRGTRTEPTQQHTPTPNTAEASKFALDHEARRTEYRKKTTNGTFQRKRGPKPHAQTPDGDL
jgi:hypothetical protein